MIGLGIGFGLAAQIFAQTASSIPEPKSISLAQALQAASHNVDTRLAKQQLASARADILAANRAPAPVLSTSISQIDLQNGVGAGSWLSEKRINKTLGVDWTWERGNKRELRTSATTAIAQATHLDLTETLIQQRLLASNAFFELLAAQGRYAQIEAIYDSAKQLDDAAAKRFAAGDISAQEAARSNIEAQRAQNELHLADEARERAALSIGLVLDIGDTTSFKALHPNPAAASQLDLKAKLKLDIGKIKQSLEERPDMQAAIARVASAKAQLDGALALQKNDITLGTAIDHLPGTSTRLLTFRLQMPLQLGALGGYTFQGEIQRAEAQLAFTEANLDKIKHSAFVDTLRLREELENGQQRAINFAQGIAPQAKRVADQAELAYRKGALSLSDLLDARRTWRATTLEAITAQSDFEKALSAWNIRYEKN